MFKKKDKEQGIPVINIFQVERDGVELFACQVNQDIDTVKLFNAIGTACKIIGSMIEAKRKEMTDKAIVMPGAVDIKNIEDSKNG